MNWLSLLIALLFTLYLVLVLPLLGRRRYQTFQAEVAVNPAARSRYYRRNIVNKWLWLVVIAIILLLNAAPLSILGLQAPADWGPTFWLLAEIAVLLPIVLVLQLRARAKTQRAVIFKLVLPIKELLPRTPEERRLWLLVSITAGVCEEIVFRGFLPFYFMQLGFFWGLQVSYLVAVILSTTLFGLVHLYQGWKSVLATGLLGAFLAYLSVFSGSLILPIIIHILLDARGVFLTRAIMKLDLQDKDVQSSPS